MSGRSSVPIYQDPEQFRYLGRGGPELWMRRRALSSGLMARDQITCVTQASMEWRNAWHDHQHLGARGAKSNARCGCYFAAVFF